MQQRNILLIGMPGAGKSTLCKALLNHDKAVHKTQAIEYHGSAIIDMPGEYVSHPQLRNIFLSEIHNTRSILFLIAVNEVPLGIPPGLLHTLPHVQLIGIISKMDTDHGEKDIARSKHFLAEQGIKEPYFMLSNQDTKSIDILRNWLINHELLPKTEYELPF